MGGLSNMGLGNLSGMGNSFNNYNNNDILNNQLNLNSLLLGQTRQQEPQQPQKEKETPPVLPASMKPPVQGPVNPLQAQGGLGGLGSGEMFNNANYELIKAMVLEEMKKEAEKEKEKADPK